MKLDQAIEMALNGDSLLFIGAGFSLDAINLRDGKFKNSGQLTEHFSKLSDIKDSNILEDVAEVYQEKFGIDSLINEIKNEFTAKSVMPYHNEIANIPWKRIYTTNYDDVIEKAFSNCGKDITSVTINDGINNVPKNSTICIHLNGFVNNLTRETIHSELKLTESSYVTASIMSSPWATLLRQDISLSRSIFFLGYSNYDLDVKRILAHSELHSNKTFFFIGPRPLESIVRRCKPFGSVLKESVFDFSRKVDVINKDYIPRDEGDFSPITIKEFKPEHKMKKITDRNFLDLLMYGRKNEDLLYESWSSDKKYYLKRTKINEIIDMVKNGSRIIVICSELGNGKSLLLDGLRLKAIENGYRAFELKEQNDLNMIELDKLTKINDKVFLTIDNYQNWFDEISYYSNNCNSESVLILTARNALNDVLIDKLHHYVDKDFIPEIHIDTLDNNEINWFIDTFDEFGLWGDNAGLSKSRKREYILNKNRSQIHAILLELLDSPDISSRLLKLTENLKSDPDLYQVAVSIFILNILNFNMNLDSIVDIWDAELINSGKFRRSKSINELIDFRTNDILLRSPIIAKYFLKNLASSGQIIDILIQIVQNVNKAAKYSHKYRDLFTDLTRFHSLQLILPDEGKKAAIIKYYESIKNLPSCKKHPLFWLQYAIASLVLEDNFRARKYFETAYSYADEKAWNTYQIDNHFARFLLVESLQLSPEICMDNFREARRIINRQILKERMHYPFKVAIQYQDFIDTFGNQLKKSELEEVLKASNDILDRIRDLPEHQARHKYLRKCKEVMEYITVKTNSYIDNK